MSGFNLVHDLLDMQLLDRRQERMGRVDGVVLELRDDAPPRVAAIVAGEGAAARRLGGWAARLGVRLRQLLHLPSPGPAVIPFERVHGIHEIVSVDVDARETPALAVECWLREHVIERIPGGGDK